MVCLAFLSLPVARCRFALDAFLVPFPSVPLHASRGQPMGFSVPPSRRAVANKGPDRFKANTAPCSQRLRRQRVVDFNMLIYFIFLS
jgi:hypothetical protein